MTTPKWLEPKFKEKCAQCGCLVIDEKGSKHSCPTSPTPKDQPPSPSAEAERVRAEKCPPLERGSR